MTESLRDQLLKSGIVKHVREERRQITPPSDKSNKPQKRKKPPNSSVEGIDLAKAYAMRAQAEISERKQAEQAAAEEARLRRERRLQIQQWLEGNTLNQANADLVRHFEYGGKIRRVHVDAAQLAALNAGQLGVVQQRGRYWLVTRVLAEQIRALDAHALALLVDPHSAGGVGDDGVPDDLRW